MRTETVIFHSVDEVLGFIKKIENYPYDMDMEHGRYTIDAKSLLGVMNLGLEKKIELKVYDENCDDLFRDIAQYIAA